MRKWLIVSLLICLPLLGLAATYKAGTDYQILQVTDGALAHRGSTVTVVEFFSPGCPACFHLESDLEPWLKRKPSYVTFSRVPLAFESGWDSYQKAYFIAVALNKDSTIVPALFNAIQVQRQDLTSQTALQKFFQSQGVSADQFNSLYNSPSMDLQLSQADDLMKTYKVYETPSIIIDGKYLVNPSMNNGDNKKMLAVIDYLIQQAKS